ncbi:hypothetical protein SGM_1413 [Streptomyces griseoaurantiacus M045]|uniref:Uncharacterized protein n=1 Tax=Streptomyces griseoaurantiacus M045 TaxID=996637 RepID=F3NE49_9ACTN|nr:hypothetical protein SGM_1413 [Streptomyces griseoaurantiacus M045]
MHEDAQRRRRGSRQQHVAQQSVRVDSHHRRELLCQVVHQSGHTESGLESPSVVQESNGCLAQPRCHALPHRRGDFPAQERVVPTQQPPAVVEALHQLLRMIDGTGSDTGQVGEDHIELTQHGLRHRRGHFIGGQQIEMVGVRLGQCVKQRPGQVLPRASAASQQQPGRHAPLMPPGLGIPHRPGSLPGGALGTSGRKHQRRPVGRGRSQQFGDQGQHRSEVGVGRCDQPGRIRGFGALPAPRRGEHRPGHQPHTGHDHLTRDVLRPVGTRKVNQARGSLGRRPQGEDLAGQRRHLVRRRGSRTCQKPQRGQQPVLALLTHQGEELSDQLAGEQLRRVAGNSGQPSMCRRERADPVGETRSVNDVEVFLQLERVGTARRQQRRPRIAPPPCSSRRLLFGSFTFPLQAPSRGILGSHDGEQVRHPACCRAGGALKAALTDIVRGDEPQIAGHGTMTADFAVDLTHVDGQPAARLCHAVPAGKPELHPSAVVMGQLDDLAVAMSHLQKLLPPVFVHRTPPLVRRQPMLSDTASAAEAAELFLTVTPRGAPSPTARLERTGRD